MKARPFMFSGTCEGCGTSKENRNAVEISVGLDDVWLCLRCARALAAKLDRAATKARMNRRSGLVYRNGRWVRPVMPGGAR